MGDIWALSAKSYRDALGLFQRAGATVGIAVGILIVASFVGIGADRLINTMLGRQVANTLLNIGAIWLASPYLVSLYRRLLTNEVVRSESLRGTVAAQRFFAWSALLAFIAATPSYLFATFVPPDLTPDTAISAEIASLTWGTFMLLLAVWIFTTRTITLLPAAALGTDGGIRLALEQTRGRFWFVVGAVTVPLLPVTLLGMLLTSSTSGMFSIIFSIGMALVVLLLALAVTANLYRWLMDNPK